MECKKRILQQLPQIQPPGCPTIEKETTNNRNTSIDDDDETQG